MSADTSADQMILVDEHDNPIGNAPKLPVHQQGLLHRAISVILWDEEGRLLLQRRALTKYHSPGLWSNTCCGHPRPGESASAAAQRRLADEMGISCETTPLFTMRYHSEVAGELIENELVHVFGGRFTGVPRSNPDEVHEWEWRDSPRVQQGITHEPDAYTIWFRHLCTEFWDELQQNATRSKTSHAQ
jgi:isopentenyl-diphosphate delta-isomerase